MTHSTNAPVPRLLILSGVRGDTRRYRAVHLWEQLQLLGFPSKIAHLVDPRLEAVISDGWEIVVLHRVALDRYVERLARQARAGGALILYDIDDLIFEPSAFRYIDSPDFADPLRASLYQETMRRFRAMLEVSDGVLASTEFLASRARELDKPAWVHRNAASLEMIKTAGAAYERRQRNDPGEVVIGYASGTLTHNRDFAQVKPAVQAVLRHHPVARLRLIGPLDPGNDWGTLAGQVEHLPPVPWRRLPEHLARFDINIAPLVIDNPFAQAKSAIKFMEAALVGVPTVASPTGAFRDAIRVGETGFLAGAAAEWEDVLEQLVYSEELRHSTGQAAREEVLQTSHPAARAAELQQTLLEIYAALRGKKFEQKTAAEIAGRAAVFLRQPEWIAAPFERDPSNRALGLYSLRHRSVKTLAQQVWIYVRRAAAPVFPFRKAEP